MSDNRSVKPIVTGDTRTVDLFGAMLIKAPPSEMTMNPVDAYDLGWRPTEEEARLLEWPGGVPPCREAKR